MNENKEIFILLRVNPFISKNEWHKNNRFICQIVLPPYKLAERDQSWQDK